MPTPADRMLSAAQRYSSPELIGEIKEIKL
jgi:hypothetical protein